MTDSTKPKHHPLCDEFSQVEIEDRMNGTQYLGNQVRGCACRAIERAVAAEREACIAACHELEIYFECCGFEKRNAGRPDNYEAGESHGAMLCRDAIRARMT